MKIESKNTGCKHQVGKVYFNGFAYFLLVKSANNQCFQFANLSYDCMMMESYDSLEEVDQFNQDDVEVNFTFTVG
jgi:hypothetical protein